ncbi:hypothetical protein [Nostoc sp.]|uniref:hypothetical protein n=1 Tax=Nostoc sp. TaxID=1180 RepID=UPI002FF76A3F
MLESFRLKNFKAVQDSRTVNFTPLTVFIGNLVRRLQPDIEISSVTLDNKPNLLSKRGQVAALLLNERCDRIIIVWDLYLPWREKKQRPCQKEDCDAIMESLVQAGVTSLDVHLVWY